MDSLPAWHRTEAIDRAAAGQWFAAAFHWERLARVEPASGLPHFGHGLALANLGQTAEARKEFRLALRLKNGLALSNQADAHAMLGHWDEAALLYAKAVTAPATSPSVWLWHALLRLQQGDQAGYRKACSVMIARFGQSTDVSIANLISWACALGPGALSDLKPALELSKRAVKGSPMTWHFHRTRGAILHRAGQQKEAIAALQRAIELHEKGGSALDLLFLALSHYRLDQPAAARKYLKQARQIMDNGLPAMWSEQVQLRVLGREAEELILGKSKDTKRQKP
jgi:Flp pilus assembly protein TadD